MKNFSVINILGVRVNNTCISNVLRSIDDRLQMNTKGYITVTGVHGIMEAQRDKNIRDAHLQSWLTVPDGMPLVYIGRMKQIKEISRCYGPDLMDAVIKKSVKSGYKHFFYGGVEGRAKELKNHFQKKYPGVKIIGTYSPPFRQLNESEEKSLISMIAELKPDIIWIGLSTPKQELFMNKYINLLDTKIMIGVGAAFDIHTGYICSAPSVMQKLALEWLFRLLQEPKRLWRRYLINNPKFLFYYCTQLIGVKTYNIDN